MEYSKEIIACIAEVITRYIRLTLKNTKYFCEIAEEVTLSMRYYLCVYDT